MALAIVVVGLPMSFIVLSLRQQNVAASRAEAATQAELGLGRLTRDLRQIAPNTAATFTWSSTGAGASFTLPQPGTQGATNETVVWSCSFGATGTCTRAVDGSAAVIEIRNVADLALTATDATGDQLGGTGPLYTATDPAFVGITLKVLDLSQLDSTATPSHGVSGINNPITVEDGVEIRNNSL
jgi:hypothetical protein